MGNIFPSQTAAYTPDQNLFSTPDPVHYMPCNESELIARSVSTGAAQRSALSTAARESFGCTRFGDSSCISSTQAVQLCMSAFSMSAEAREECRTASNPYMAGILK